jgi:hypothetical protein
VFQNFKVKVKPLSELKPVWNSQNTQSAQQVSIWAPSLATSLLSGSSRTRLCLGHYAARGLGNPLKSRVASGAGKYCIIEVTDFATLRMKRAKVVESVVNLAFPHPLRFKLSWHMQRGEQSLYAWRPQAPENFVALGMVCTVTGTLGCLCVCVSVCVCVLVAC